MSDHWRPSCDILPKIYVLYYIYYCCDDATKQQFSYTCRKMAMLYYHEGRQRSGVAAHRFWQFDMRLRNQHEFHWSQYYGDACRWRPTRTILLRGQPLDGQLLDNAQDYVRAEWQLGCGVKLIDTRLIARCIEITGARNYTHAINWQYVRMVRLRTPDACVHLLNQLLLVCGDICCKIYGFNARHECCYIKFCKKTNNNRVVYRITAHGCCNIEIPVVTDTEKLVYRSCRM